MYNKVLVPLDGSYISESALDHARAVVKGCRISGLHLLMIVEPFRKSFSQVSEERIEGMNRESAVLAQNYLDQLVMKFKAEGIKASAVVIEGDPADGILKYISRNDIDLVVLTSHGRSGALRWVFGSVARKVVQNASVPVIMVPARYMKNDSILNMAD